jgi:molecular chaperone Hsp33
MIMSKIADSRMAAFSPSAKIRVVLAEVTDSARELERSHLCGPTAGLIQAEALAGVALLGADLSEADETVTFRMRVSGPLEGFLVEAAADGGLRGYTNVKVLNEMDAAEELDTSAALGEQAEVQIIRSRPGKVIASGSIDLTPAAISHAIELYYKNSLQRSAWVQTSALAYGAFIDSARAVMVECLPDGDDEVFAKIEELFSDGTVLDCLEAAASLKTVCETIGLEDCTFEDAKPLRFACRCSAERVEGMVAGLPTEDVRAMLAKNEPVQIFCHLCGKGYRVGGEYLERVLKERE